MIPGQMMTVSFDSRLIDSWSFDLQSYFFHLYAQYTLFVKQIDSYCLYDELSICVPEQ